MKRGRCDSSLTTYLDKLILDAGWTDVDLEKNTNFALLQLIFGQYTKIFVVDEANAQHRQESRLITAELYHVLYDLCENENDQE